MKLLLKARPDAKPEARPKARPGAPRALHVEAALVDRHLRKLADQMIAQRAELEGQIRRAVSPLERERLRKALYELDETLGAIRYSPVTGSDASDLQETTP